MNDFDRTFHMTRPQDARQVLGQWLRRSRQRQDLTQPMLSSKSGVPVATLSRLEREGAGGIDNLMRVLRALGELDGFYAHLQEQVRQSSLPRDISELQKPDRPRQRVRIRTPKQGAP
jgi:transcriptional regulator with XRE-family HTH domain